MKATRLEGHTTVFLVTGESMRCTTPGCHGTAAAGTVRADARVCGKCGGPMEPSVHQVDTAQFGAVGGCSCEKFQFGWIGEGNGMYSHRHGQPWLSRQSPAALRALTPEERARHRCRHLVAARDAQLDECLLVLKEQERAA